MKKLQLSRACKSVSSLSVLMTKGIFGIIIITLAVVATAASYLICLPFLLFGNLRQLFKEENS